MAINFFEEGVASGISSSNRVRRWLRKVADTKGYTIKNLNYVFCNDEYLYEMNVQYLKHQTYTDIITFDQSEDNNIIEGDIYISTDRVKDNAHTHGADYPTELLRVISHGLLHLCGHQDKTKRQSEEMRMEEDKAIAIYQKMNP